MEGGPSQGSGTERIPDEVAQQIAGGKLTTAKAIHAALAVDPKQYPADALVDWHLLDFMFGRSLSELRSNVHKTVSSAEPMGALGRSIGCLLGLVVGDALGGPLEFVPVSYASRSVSHGNSTSKAVRSKKRGKQRSSASAPKLENSDKSENTSDSTSTLMSAGFDASASQWADKSAERLSNRFELKPGQWTDDGAMALCLADSLLACKGLDLLDLRLRFLLWWRYGYCNAFAADADRLATYGNRASIGLGETIGQTILEFERDQQAKTSAGRLHDSGNGSVMRNAPIAIRYHRHLDTAMKAAWDQSMTTHQGREAADCARLLTFFCAHAISTGCSMAAALAHLEEFSAETYAVACLARGEAEAKHEDNKGVDLADRDWSWRTKDYRYAASRAAADPEYVGSYVMDAMAMALHCVHITNSFEAAVLRAANTCGDADTVAAITGQLAGAVYGVQAIPEDWRETVQRWDRGGDICVRASQLFLAAESEML
mmetsp:Transcript_130516/g.240075  ORF Transcript_130516/g.240075 Transcript_130516/m.240075 type:complete len:487 (+) Transcript_130516:96-1556(+)